MIKFKRFMCLLLVLVTMAGMTTIAHAEEINLVQTEDTKWNKMYENATMIVEEIYDEVPLYNQLDYNKTPYGDYGTVASHGCGITCLAMVATYLLDVEYMPDELAKAFGRYNTPNGSYWILFEDSAKALGLNLQERTNSEKKVMQALANGQVVISLQRAGLFTGGGHFITLVGLTEDGKILVNDPNGANYWKGGALANGFKNGFSKNQVFEAGGPYWIYEVKTSAVAEVINSLGE